MDSSKTDPITALLNAAANPKLPKVVGEMIRYSDGSAAAEQALLDAARNGLRAFAEELLFYGSHTDGCLWMDPQDECTCGWFDRRQQIEAYLEATKGDQNARP